MTDPPTATEFGTGSAVTPASLGDEQADEQFATETCAGSRSPKRLRSVSTDETNEADSPTGDALRNLCDSFTLIQDTRKVLSQRSAPFADPMKLIEEQARRALEKEFKSHVIYDWLPKGLKGSAVARIVATIGDPWRFPGQKCSEGHTSAARFEVGSPCPWSESRNENDRSSAQGGDSAPACESETLRGVPALTDLPFATDMDVVPGQDSDAVIEHDSLAGEPCPGTMLAPRTTTGVASLWHYCGLIPDSTGLKLIRKRKGQQATFSPKLKSLLLMPDVGVRSQIVKHRTPVYRERYDTEKERLLARELPRYKADQIAGIIAVKMFLGDMLVEWKRRTDCSLETDE